MGREECGADRRERRTGLGSHTLQPPGKCRAGLRAASCRSAPSRPRAPSGRRALRPCLAPGRTPAGGCPRALGCPRARQGPAPAARGFRWFCFESKPGNQLLLETHPYPLRGALWERGDRVPPSVVEPGLARVGGHRGPAALTGRSARAGAAVRGVVLARAPPARACPLGHNKWGANRGAVVRPAGGDPPRGLSRGGLGTTRGRNPGLERSHGSPAALARLLFALWWGGVILR